MAGRIARIGDPFEGRGASRRHLRVKVESLLALGIAIAACGLTAAVWVTLLAPLGRVIGLD